MSRIERGSGFGEPGTYNVPGPIGDMRAKFLRMELGFVDGALAKGARPKFLRKQRGGLK